MNIADSIYYHYNKKAVDEGRRYMKKISVKKFIDWYLKSLTSKHDDFKIIIQNSEYADILAWKGNKKYLFRYHKCQIVFSEQYETFLTQIEINDASKAFYFTCGVFEESILRRKRAGDMVVNYRLYTIDGFHIVKKILGLNRKWINAGQNLDIFDVYSP